MEMLSRDREQCHTAYCPPAAIFDFLSHTGSYRTGTSCSRSCTESKFCCRWKREEFCRGGVSPLGCCHLERVSITRMTQVAAVPPVEQPRT